MSESKSSRATPKDCQPYKDVWQMEQLLEQTRQQAAERVASMEVLDLPEIFDLRPQASQPIKVRVLQVEPASFYFVAEDDIPARGLSDMMGLTAKRLDPLAIDGK